MKASTLLICAVSLVLTATGLRAESRTWTSAADPSQTFEGELIAAGADGTITVKRSDGNELTFPLTVVSAADQAYVKEMADSLPKAPERGPVAKEIASAVGGGIGNLGTAEYFIIWAAANR